MQDRNAGLTADTLFVAVTRPPMRFGVTYVAMLMNLVFTIEGIPPMNNPTDGADGPTVATGERRRQTEICPLLIASTAHVTVGEAQALTDHGYSRREYGWFLYVGQPGEPILSEIEPVSAGLEGVIRRARLEGCRYVLLDRDAGILPDAPTYDW